MNDSQRGRTYLLLLLALFAVALAALGCRESAEPRLEAIVADTAARRVADTSSDGARATWLAYRQRVDEMKRSAPPGLDICSVRRHVSAALDTLMRWPLPLIEGDDGCVLEVLDSLVDRYVETADPRYLEVLDSIDAYSDGYVGEALGFSADSAFNGRPKELLTYFEQRRADRAPLEHSLITQWRVEIGESAGSSVQRRELLSRVERIAPRTSLDAGQQATLDRILREARLID